MLRVLTLNLWNVAGPWKERREEIVAWLRNLSADVVCVQEVLADADGPRNTAHWIAENTGYDHVALGLVEGRPGMLFGNAVLATTPIDHEAVHLLPTEERPGDVQRLLLHARTGGVDVFTTHLTSLYECGEQRERQVVRIDEVIRAEADPASALPPILAGDFNAEPDSTEIRFLTGSTSLQGRSTYYQDAWRVAGGREPGWTWSNANPFAAAEHEPDRRIDYVFAGWRRDDGRGRITACSVVADRPLSGTWPTDHFGLLADIAT
ncbi:MAG: endonuclease/exonuclease/phosphatase family protein [Actinomycetota bacterium]|nr:endonuclease/exonuclease/phosphatase family protein [Actinomycetota bacterium]